MPIKTKDFNVTPKELRRILIAFQFMQAKPMFILYTTISLLAITAYLMFQEIFFLFFILAATLVVLIALSLPFLLDVKKQQNNLQFQTRHCEIEEDFFSTFFADGSSDKIRFDNFRKAIRRSDYYFLYLTALQFYYLPIAAFHTEDDLKCFHSLLKDKGLLESV